MNLSDEKFDIIIQGGQSNAEGCGVGPVTKEYVPSPDILYLESEKQVDGYNIEYADKPFSAEIAKERTSNGMPTGDFSLTFAQEYIKNGFLKEGRKLLIVRAAIGGTGFMKKQWGLEDKVFLKMLEMVDFALSLNPENRIEAFLWHQGEHEAYEGNLPENYYKQLSDMLAKVRLCYGESIPFICGDFVNDWKTKNKQSAEPIVQEIRRVVKDNDKAAFAETADLLSNDQKNHNGDEIHFCREALHELGKRYFAKFRTICENK